jgi:hypothetical protein
MQIGDKIVLKAKLHIPNDSVYTIIEINGDCEVSANCRVLDLRPVTIDFDYCVHTIVRNV